MSHNKTKRDRRQQNKHKMCICLTEFVWHCCTKRWTTMSLYCFLYFIQTSTTFPSNPLIYSSINFFGALQTITEKDQNDYFLRLTKFPMISGTELTQLRYFIQLSDIFKKRGKHINANVCSMPPILSQKRGTSICYFPWLLLTRQSISYWLSSLAQG